MRESSHRSHKFKPKNCITLYYLTYSSALHRAIKKGRPSHGLGRGTAKRWMGCAVAKAGGASPSPTAYSVAFYPTQSTEVNSSMPSPAGKGDHEVVDEENFLSCLPPGWAQGARGHKSNKLPCVARSFFFIFCCDFSVFSSLRLLLQSSSTTAPSRREP